MNTFWRRRDEVKREIEAHIEERTDELIESGVSPEEARFQARREFGNATLLTESSREVWGWLWLDRLVQDLRYAARIMRRSPGFTAIAVLSLGLGIGANTAIFTLIDAVMLRTLPVKDPQRLVRITRVDNDGRPLSVSYPLFEYFRNNLKTITAAAVQTGQTPLITIDGAEEVVNAELVSGDHYAMLGVAPAAGRLLDSTDDVIAPAVPSAVISYRYWQQHFGLSPAAIGKTFITGNQIFTIIGVTPAWYPGTRPTVEPDITLPLTMMISAAQRTEPTNNSMDMMGRLAPGITREQADAELQVLWQNFLNPIVAAEPEKDRPDMLKWRAGVLPAAGGINSWRYDYSQALFILMGIVGLVLLLVCANLAGLLLARAASRQREISIRLAIGAGGGRLIRQFLAESFVLAALGGSVGLVLAQWLSRALVVMMANDSALNLSTALDWRVLGFTGVISLAACVIAGLAPGWHALRSNLNPGLLQTRAASQPRLGKTLVVAQLAISMVLLVGAALFGATLVKLYHVDRGLRTDGLLLVDPRGLVRYPQAKSWAVQQALLERLRTYPGVTSAAAVSVLPIAGNDWVRRVSVEGYQFRADESEGTDFNTVSPNYFNTVGTPLLAGREFDAHDTSASTRVTIVNETFARYFFGNQSPLGRHVTSVDVTYEIVGVVKDAKYQSLRDAVPKTMYICWLQREGDQASGYYYLARVAAGDPMRLAPAMEKLVRETDSGLRLRSALAYDTIVDRSVSRERILAMLGGFFGMLALVVACLGIFGVMAFQLSRRINEIGLRMALGASRGGIAGMVMREVAVMLAIGVPGGAAAALTLTGLTRKILFGVTPAEPGVFVIAAVVLAAAAFSAAWLPARRATRIDPMVALRHE
jgi:predicted permease